MRDRVNGPARPAAALDAMAGAASARAEWSGALESVADGMFEILADIGARDMGAAETVLGMVLEMWTEWTWEEGGERHAC